jgi:hypothetical protein
MFQPICGEVIEHNVSLCFTEFLFKSNLKIIMEFGCTVDIVGKTLRE